MMKRIELTVLKSSLEGLTGEELSFVLLRILRTGKIDEEMGLVLCVLRILLMSIFFTFFRSCI